MARTIAQRLKSLVDSDERRAPLESFIPKNPPMGTLKAGSKLVRIYNHAEALTGGYGAADFNPTTVRDFRWIRGRFSSTKVEPFSYLYLGESVVDERIAILEYLDRHDMMRDPTKDAMHLVVREDVVDLSFAYFVVTKDIPIVDLTTKPQAHKIKAKLAALEGQNQKLTRRWARYLRRVIPHNEGLLYRPNRYGSSKDGHAVVLFAPHKTSSASVRLVGKPMKLGDPNGRTRLLACADATNFTPNGSW